MALITTAVREELIALYIGMFKAAPGANNLSAIVAQYESGMDTFAIAASLATSANFATVHPGLQTADEFADALIAALLGDDVIQSAKDWSKTWIIGKMQGGMAKSQVIANAVIALRSGINVNYDGAKAALDNKTEVASYYSVTKLQSSTSLAVLQGIVDGVTSDDATVAPAKVEVDTGAAVALGQTFALTAGVDNVVGTAGNDTITGSSTTLTGLDIVDGGGAVDTFTVSDVDGTVNLANLLLVKNVEILNYVSTKDLSAITDISSWTGLTSATVTLQDVAAAQSLTVPNTAALTVTTKVTTADDLTFGGGTTVNITQSNAVDSSGKTITINGGAATSAATVTQTATTAAWEAAVTVNDLNNASDVVADTITTVTLTGLNGGVATINSDALATLNLNKVSKNVTIDNDTASHALTINANAVSAGTIADAKATTVTVNAVTAGSTITLDVDVATALTVNATVATTLGTGALAGDDKLVTLTYTGAGALTADLTGISSLTTINASASTGKNTVSVDSAVSSYAGGSGVDIVTVKEAPTKNIGGGDGTADVLVINVAAATFSDPSANTKVSGFEVLSLGATADGSYVAAGFTSLTHGAVANDVTYTKVAAGAGLTITASPTKDTVYTLADATGKTDSAAFTLTSAGAIAAGKITAAGVEAITLATTGTTHTLTLTAVNAASLTVTGSNTSLVLTNDAGNTALKTFDASAVTAGAITYASKATTGSTSIKGGAGIDTLSGGDGTTDTIEGNGGADVIASGKGLDILTGGAGNDSFTLVANTDGNLYATITDGTKGDILVFANVGTETFATTAITLAGTAVFQDYLNVAADDNAGATDANIAWFQFTGDTYVVFDRSDSVDFVNGTDIVVKLTGAISLATATVDAAGSLTLG